MKTTYTDNLNNTAQQREASNLKSIITQSSNQRDLIRKVMA